MFINLLQFFLTEFRNNDIFQAITPVAFRVSENHNKDEKLGDLFFVCTEIDRKSFLTTIEEERTFKWLKMKRFCFT